MSISITPAVDVQNLVKTYPGAVRALNGLTFSVQPGTIFALLGPNGAGKSTTVKILTTLSRPDAGAASIAGIDVLKTPHAVRQVIGYVAQRSGVDREATARENLMLQGHLYKLGGRALSRRVTELLERFGLADVANRVVGGYSGGMQRRLDIAMGLIHGPRVLFLDEPTTGLDPEVRAALWQEIARLRADEGLTILLTTHYLEEADRLAQRLAIVDHGRVVVEGSPEELKGELHGDAIHVELSSPYGSDAIDGALKGLTGVREVIRDGQSLHARVDRGATMVPAILAALESDGIHVASVTVSRPSLDDVYLRYTGHAFEQNGLGYGNGNGTEGSR